MTVSEDALLAVAAHWSGRLPARSREIETARQLPPDIARAFTDGGIFHALVPVEYGGGEVHPLTLVEVIRLLSMGDGSAGWTAMIGATTGLLAASLPDEFAREIYGAGPGVLSVGVTAPLGKAQRVAGGYSVTGRWPFGSGSRNADWICGGSHIHDRDGTGAEEAPATHLMMFRREQVDIEDTWRVSGLCGTGSHHFRVTEQFVPEGRSVMLGGRPRVRRPLYQFPMLGLLALGVAAVSLGIGCKALAAFKELAATKTPTGATRSLARRSGTQALVAEAVADLESAQGYIDRVVGQAWEGALKGERLAAGMKARLRLAAANATSRSVAAVDRLYRAGGGSAIYESSLLQQCFRDVHVTTQHIMVAPPIYEVVGRVELGLEPKSAL